MLVFVAIVNIYLARQEEACEDKMCAGKTPRSVSRCEI